MRWRRAVLPSASLPPLGCLEHFCLFSFFTLGTGLARTGTNTGTPREPPKRLLKKKIKMIHRNAPVFSEVLRFSSRHRPPRRSSGSLAHPPLHIPPRLATHPPPHLTVTSTGNVHLVTAGLSANGAAASQRGARGHTPGSTLHVSTAPHLPPRQRASVLASQRLSISVTFHGSRAYRPTALGMLLPLSCHVPRLLPTP